MNKKVIVIIAIFLFITIGIIFFAKLNKDTEIGEDEQKITLVSEEIEDECTDEYLEEQIKPVAFEEEKVSANAQLILKKYFTKCEHTTNEIVELPNEIVNMTKKEVQSQYPDWQVIGFSPEKVTLYKEYDDVCDEHFKLKIEEGKVVVYIINKDGQESVYEKTNISSEYLTETDLINMQDGLEIYGKEQLNRIIEDFE